MPNVCFRLSTPTKSGLTLVQGSERGRRDEMRASASFPLVGCSSSCYPCFESVDDLASSAAV